MSSFSLRFYHIVSVQNVVGKAPCADFIALCGDTGINELHTFLKVKMFFSGFGREDKMCIRDSGVCSWWMEAAFTTGTEDRSATVPP